MNESDLETLKENFIIHFLDSMDFDTLYQFAFDSIHETIEIWSEEEIKKEMLEMYDEETLRDLSPDSPIKVTYSDTMKPAS